MGDQPDFDYQIKTRSGEFPLCVSLFTDRPVMREQLAEDLVEAGFHLLQCGSISELFDRKLALLGDAVLLDCPRVNAAMLASLERLDMRVARSGAQLIVSTTIASLDDVFACFSQSAPQILVDPTRAERIVAMGRILSGLGQARVRELSRAERSTLLQISQQVDVLAKQIEGLSGSGTKGANPPERMREHESVFRGFGEIHDGRSSSLPMRLPEARVVRVLIARRQARAKFFDAELFADPAWDMLLDLTAAHIEGKPVSVTSLCIASGVPATTALRWISQMTELGLFERVEDPQDRRRSFISLSVKARHAMAGFFAATGEHALDYAA